MLTKESLLLHKLYQSYKLFPCFGFNLISTFVDLVIAYKLIQTVHINNMCDDGMKRVCQVSAEECCHNISFRETTPFYMKSHKTFILIETARKGKYNITKVKELPILLLMIPQSFYMNLRIKKNSKFRIKRIRNSI